MSYRRWREETINECGRYGINYQDSLYLLRQASTLQRVNEIECSIDVGEREMARLWKQSAGALERVRKWADEHGPGREWVDFNGDPRGCPFSIGMPEYGEGRRIHFPGRGLPSRCFH